MHTVFKPWPALVAWLLSNVLLAVALPAAALTPATDTVPSAEDTASPGLNQTVDWADKREARAGEMSNFVPGFVHGLSREQAAKRARENNPALFALNRQVERARGQRLRADGFAPPTVYWDFEEARNSQPGEFGSQVYGVEQTFEWFGVRSARKRAAELGIQAAQAMVERGRLRVTAQVYKTYDRLLLIGEVKKLLERMLGLTGEAVKISHTRFKSSQGQYVDLMRFKLQRSELKSALRDITLKQETARRQLARLLGVDTLSLELTEPLAFTPENLDAQAKVALLEQQSPSLQMFKHKIAQAQQRLAAARSGRYPDITVGLGRQKLNDGITRESAWAGQLSLTFPLPGSDYQSGREAEALAERYALIDQVKAYRLEVETRYRQRLQDAELLQAQLRDYRQQILPDSDNQLKAAQQEYRVRRIDALNLLDVYDTFLETRRNYLETLVRYRAALADIETLGEDLWEITL